MHPYERAIMDSEASHTFYWQFVFHLTPQAAPEVLREAVPQIMDHQMVSIVAGHKR